MTNSYNEDGTYYYDKYASFDDLEPEESYQLLRDIMEGVAIPEYKLVERHDKFTEAERPDIFTNSCSLVGERTSRWTIKRY